MLEPILILSDYPNHFPEQKSDCDCDCDCACPQPLVQQASIVAGMMAAFDQPAIRSSGLRLALEQGWQVVYPRVGRMAVLNRPAVELLERFNQAAIPREMVRKPEETEALVNLLHQGLIEPVEPACARREMRQVDAIQNLSAWLQITDRCNLRCGYCYIKQSPHELSLATGKAIIDALIRTAQAHAIPNIKLKYAGGEPLLRFELVKKLHTYAQKRASDAQIELQGVLLSNGLLLTKSILEQIYKLNLHLMLSLDELNSEHSVRLLPSRQNSTQIVRAAIELALSHQVIPSVSITVIRPTLPHLSELTGWLSEKQIPFSLNFYRQPRHSQALDPLALDESAVPEILKTYRMLCQQHPEQSLLNGVLDRTNLAHAHEYACGAGRNYLAFDTQGQLSACQMLQSEAQSFDLASCDLLEAVRQLASNNLNPPAREKSACLQCEWTLWCAGGCSLAAYYSSGDYFAPTPHCALYRAIFPQILRLEAKRIMAGAKISI